MLPQRDKLKGHLLHRSMEHSPIDKMGGGGLQTYDISALYAIKEMDDVILVIFGELLDTFEPFGYAKRVESIVL